MRHLRIVTLSFALLAVFVSVAAAQEGPVVYLREIASGLASPLAVMSAGDETDRLFIIDQVGIVWIVGEDGQRLEQPFLDIRDRLVELRTGYDERGLLGLAFHPNYEENGRFFVKYSAPVRPEAPPDYTHTNVVSEFMVSPTDPNRADHDSERILLEVDHPQRNHNGGTIAFGPDGYLYIGEGDGGGANDVGNGHPPLGNGQDITTILGNILRIDVDSSEQPYGVPADNPFVGREGEDEIFAYGFRNPYQFSFDMGGEHGLLVGDAGQNLYEEVSQVALGGNYGWNLKEGTHCFDPENPSDPPEDCPDTGYRDEPLLDPVIEFVNTNHPREEGLANTVVGGHVYRGQLLPQFRGEYIFGGYDRPLDSLGPNGQLFIAYPVALGGEDLWEMEVLRVLRRGQTEPGSLGHYVKGFGQDRLGEVYVATSDSAGPTGETGRIYKLAGPAGSADRRHGEAGIGNLRDVGSIAGPGGLASGVRFTLEAAAPVGLTLHDVTGRSVRSLVDAPLASGKHAFVWDGRTDSGQPAPTGVYFARLRAGSEAQSLRVFLMR